MMLTSLKHTFHIGDSARLLGDWLRISSMSSENSSQATMKSTPSRPNEPNQQLQPLQLRNFISQSISPCLLQATRWFHWPDGIPTPNSWTILDHLMSLI